MVLVDMIKHQFVLVFELLCHTIVKIILLNSTNPHIVNLDNLVYQIGIASGPVASICNMLKTELYWYWSYIISTCLIKGAKSAIIVCLGIMFYQMKRCIRDINVLKAAICNIILTERSQFYLSNIKGLCHQVLIGVMLAR